MRGIYDLRTVDTPTPEGSGILGSSSPLNSRSFPPMPEMVLSSARKQTRRQPPGCNCCERFLLLCRSQFPSAPRYCRKTQILVSLYLMLRLFTSRSVPLKNPLSLVVKVRCLSATGCLKRLFTLSSVLIITYLKVLLSTVSKFIPYLKAMGASISRSSL